MAEQMNINVPIEYLRDRLCKCGGKVFLQAMILKEIPALYSPSGKIETMMVQVGFKCEICGELMSLRPEDKTAEGPKLILAEGN